MQARTDVVAQALEDAEPAHRPHPLLTSVPICLALAFVGGLITSLQAYLNGRLGRHLGSPELAALVNMAIGLVILVTIALVRGALRPGLQRLRAALPRSGPPLPWWVVLPGAGGTFFLIVAAISAPRVGVALLTVALVAGQASGGLLVDRLGLSPGARRRFTVPRVLGALLAIVAVLIGALDSSHHVAWGLLALGVAAGVGVAVQQAALGRMTVATGQPIVSAVVNFTFGTMFLVTIALIVTGGSAPGSWSAPFPEYLGGLIGAIVIVTAASVVPTLGVLRLLLALVAGQSLGALLIDAIAPVSGQEITIWTVVTIVLTVVAVAVSSGGRRAPAPPAMVSRR